ncbi:MAG TPA: ribosome maturation factor RimP [Alcanivoracaceae bacterium]|nr:ribosome maturation factor RimP [Alcanivoracaceae bacterium]
MRKIDQLKAILAPVVESMGFEFWGVQYIQGRGAVVRIFIDHEEGISVDDCADVSHQVSGVLDVEDPINTEYVLEVSSPGMDRPLFTLEQWQRFIGEKIKVRLLGPIEGRRRFTGELLEVNEEDEQVSLRHDADVLLVPFGQIDRANVEPQFD